MFKLFKAPVPFYCRTGAGREGRLLPGLFLRQTGDEFQALLRTGLHAAAAEDAAELLKAPHLGIAGDFDGVGGTLADTHAAEDTLILFDDQFAPFKGERFTFDCGVVPGHRTLDKVADNIFENGK